MTLEQAEKWAIEEAIIATGGNMSKAADVLQIGRTTLYRKVVKYEIDTLSLIRPGIPEIGDSSNAIPFSIVSISRSIYVDGSFHTTCTG